MTTPRRPSPACFLSEMMPVHLLTCKHTVQSLQLFILAGLYHDYGREQWKRHPVLFWRAGSPRLISFWRALLDATRQLLSQQRLISFTSSRNLYKHA